MLPLNDELIREYYIRRLLYLSIQDDIIPGAGVVGLQNMNDVRIL
ncbi:MAG: hypothetical protein AAFN42_21715 [Cyanobacteria bacterium J06554_1]